MSTDSWTNGHPPVGSPNEVKKIAYISPSVNILIQIAVALQLLWMKTIVIQFICLIGIIFVILTIGLLYNFSTFDMWVLTINITNAYV